MIHGFWDTAEGLVDTGYSFVKETFSDPRNISAGPLGITAAHTDAIYRWLNPGTPKPPPVAQPAPQTKQQMTDPRAWSPDVANHTYLNSDAYKNWKENPFPEPIGGNSLQTDLSNALKSLNPFAGGGKNTKGNDEDDPSSSSVGIWIFAAVAGGLTLLILTRR